MSNTSTIKPMPVWIEETRTVDANAAHGKFLYARIFEMEVDRRLKPKWDGRRSLFLVFDGEGRWLPVNIDEVYVVGTDEAREVIAQRAIVRILERQADETE